MIGTNDINVNMTDPVKSLYDAGEPYAAGFFTRSDRTRFYRFSYAQRMFWEHAILNPYNKGKLYPCGKLPVDQYAVKPNYSFTFSVDWGLLHKKNCLGIEQIKQESDLLNHEDTPHTVGGFGYTHSIPNYGRICKEGLDSYVERINSLEQSDFKDGLLEVVFGIRTYRDQCLELLKESNAYPPLIQTLQRVPFLPARNIYEALVCWNFIYFIDGCDNPGRLDAELIHFYQGEDMEDVIREFFMNVDDNNGWSLALGPDCNPITLQCLRAVKHLRRPNMELRVNHETPKHIWDAAADALVTGCGQPAFYNEKEYQNALSDRFSYIPKEDLLQFNGGGCTETMLAGISNVGSLDAGINLPLIFYRSMNDNLVHAVNFQEFYDKLIQRIHTETGEVLDILNLYRKKRAQVRPQPVRTLLIDDCIDKELDFNAGGARYYWSVINFAGLVNVIDSLLAIRTLVFENKTYDAKAFIRLLHEQDPVFLQQCRLCPCFGVDDDGADLFAVKLALDVFDTLNQNTPFLGGAFLPSSIQFTTYASAGASVPATPDGRVKGAPLADSLGAIHGKDKEGLTALLNSVAKLPLYKAVGTPILNIRLQKNVISRHLKGVIMGFFDQGGMQAQISCLSKEDIQDAMNHPEKHENLIVRIGGYSEYFNRLSPALKLTVLERTEFDVG